MDTIKKQYNKIRRTGEKKMTQKFKPDVVLKEYWNDNERYADFFNAVLFNGRRAISASQLEPQDTEASSTLQLGDSAESVTAARDLFKVVKTAMGVEFMLVGIEHQDKIHYAMPVRVMNLDAYAYNKQWKLLKEKYKHEKGMTQEEYLSHMRREDKFLPVLSVVIYYGEKKWDGAKDLHGVLDIPEEIKPFVGNYPMHLVEVADNQLSFENANNIDLFEMMKILYDTTNSRKQRVQRAQEYEKEHDLDDDVIRVLAAINNVQIKRTGKKEELNMCSLFEEIARENKAEGKAESVLELLEDYGEISEELRMIVMKQTDLGVLREWLLAAARSGSIEEFERVVKSRGNLQK